MLEAARERGVKLVRGRVVGIDTPAGACARLQVEQQGERQIARGDACRARRRADAERDGAA